MTTQLEIDKIRSQAAELNKQADLLEQETLLREILKTYKFTRIIPENAEQVTKLAVDSKGNLIGWNYNKKNSEGWEQRFRLPDDFKFVAFITPI